MTHKPFKTSTSSAGRPMHYTVGALIERDGKILLMDRAITPFGYAGPAGHIDLGEEPLPALHREVKEETQLDIVHAELLFEEEIYNEKFPCVAGCTTHYWYLYKCETRGEPQPDEESKSLDWYTPEEIRELPLEHSWKYWFEKML